MLAADVYRYGQKYPPTGSAWMQFGDNELDRAMSSLSHDIQKALHQRKEVMKPLHQERLQKMGLAPMAIEPRTQFYSIADQPPLEEPQEAMEAALETPAPSAPSAGPSRLEQAGRFVRNYAWPITRDILGPATADMAGALTGAGIYLTKKAAWNLADVLFAIGGAEAGEEGEEAAQAHSYPMLADGADPAQEQRVNELAGRGKGWLIEQIYSKPGWMEMFGVVDERGYRNGQTAEFRRKLGSMSTNELAKVLMALS
jgi:hypothetical protein